MTTGTIMAMIIGAIIVSIVIGYKTDINIGFICIGFAYIIGVFVLKIKPATIVNYWPLTITVQMIAILAFYGFANTNGTLKILAERIIYPFRKTPQILPVVIFTVIMFLGMTAGQMATTGFMPLLTFTIAAQAGWHPAFMAIICCLGAVVGSSVPFSQTGIMIKAALEATEYQAVAEVMTWKVAGTSYLIMIIMFVVLYFIFGAYKVKKIEMEKPESFNSIQKKTLIVVLAIISVLVFPSIFKYFDPTSFLGKFSDNVDLALLYIVGFLVCAFMNLGDQKKIINSSIPWYSIIMIGGTAMLVTVATNSGASKFITAMITSSVPTLLIGPFFVLLAGALSFFAAFFLTFPILFPLVFSICAATGLNPIMLITLSCFPRDGLLGVANASAVWAVR